jgi:hypothetical protein
MPGFVWLLPSGISAAAEHSAVDAPDERTSSRPKSTEHVGVSVAASMSCATHSLLHKFVRD